MQPDDWTSTPWGSVALILNGSGERSIFMLFNPGAEPVGFTVPERGALVHWRLLVSTEDGVFEPEVPPIPSGGSVLAQPRTLTIFETAEVLA